MRYDKFLYIYPPRPSSKIQFGSETFKQFQNKRGYIAQLKMNGQRNIIYRFPNGDIEFWNRHKEHHRNYTVPGWLIEQLNQTFDFPDNAFTVLDCELLHNKDRTTKNILYFWDTLVCDNEYLIGSTYQNRYDLLRNMIKTPLVEDLVLRATPNIWIAQNLSPLMWDAMWGKTATSFVEGFVIKNTLAKLEFGFKKENNGLWQVRCRKPHKNYQF